MLIVSTQLNVAVFLVFLTLELTEIFLFIGNFTTKVRRCRPTPPLDWIVIGGIIGIVTALVAWYTSAAGVMNGHKGKVGLPVGKPLFDLVAASSSIAMSPGTLGPRAHSRHGRRSP